MTNSTTNNDNDHGETHEHGIVTVPTMINNEGVNGNDNSDTGTNNDNTTDNMTTTNNTSTNDKFTNDN